MPAQSDRYQRFPPNRFNRLFLDLAPEDAAHLCRTPLYLVGPDGGGHIVKGEGIRLRDLSPAAVDPNSTSIFHQDRELAIEEIQASMIDGFLRDMVKNGGPELVRNSFATLLDEAFKKPNVKTIVGFSGMLKVLLREFEEDPVFLRSFQMAAESGFGLADHSINVMAMVAGFCLRQGQGREATNTLCLTAMFHDIGKSALPEAIRAPGRPLTDSEFREFQLHPVHGEGIVAQAGIGREVLQGILQHHERNDGTGYPNHSAEVSWAGQVVGLADCYDALTGPLFRAKFAMEPLEVLRLLKEETGTGKFQDELFRAFAYSLAE